jgi:hypothetical protein
MNLPCLLHTPWMHLVVKAGGSSKARRERKRNSHRWVKTSAGKGGLIFHLRIWLGRWGSVLIRVCVWAYVCICAYWSTNLFGNVRLGLNACVRVCVCVYVYVCWSCKRRHEWAKSSAQVGELVSHLQIWSKSWGSLSFIYGFIYVYIDICIYTHIWAKQALCINILANTQICYEKASEDKKEDQDEDGRCYIYIYICVCVCMYVCMYVCMHIYTHMSNTRLMNQHTDEHADLWWKGRWSQASRPGCGREMLYIYIYIYIYIYMHIYTHMSNTRLMNQHTDEHADLWW